MDTKENGFAGLDTKFTFNNKAVKRHLGNLAKWQKSGIFSYGGRRGDSMPKFINGEFRHVAEFLGLIRQHQEAGKVQFRPGADAVLSRPDQGTAEFNHRRRDIVGS